MKLIVQVGVIAAMVLAGCGGDDEDPGGVAESGTGAGATTVVAETSGGGVVEEGSDTTTDADGSIDDATSGDVVDPGADEVDPTDASDERAPVDGFRRVPDPCSLLEWSEVEAWTSLSRTEDDPEFLEQTMGTLTCVWATELDPDELIARGISVSVMETEAGGPMARQVVEATQEVLAVDITADISRVPGRPFADELGQFGTILDDDLVVTVGSFTLFDQLEDGFDPDDQDFLAEILVVVLERLLA